MTVDYTKLALLAHGNDKKLYYYDAGTDTVAQVVAQSYFNNRTGLQRLVAGDLIFCKCTDGDTWLKISAVIGNTASSSSGAITTQVSGVGSAFNGVIGSASAAITVPGVTELGTGTASSHVLGAVPYAGARVNIVQSGTATTGISVITSSAGVTLDAAGDRTLNFTGKGQNAELLGTSASRWVVTGGNFSSISA